MANTFTVNTTFRAIDNVTQPLQKIKSKIDIFNTSLDNTRNKLKKSMDMMGGGLIKKGIALASIGIGYFGKQALDVAANFESIETSIRYISGSTQNADKNMQFLRQTASGLKIDYAVAADSFKRFLGAMKSTNISSDRQRDIFYKLSAATRVLGMDAEGTERTFYAVGEMFSKGTIMSQELKQQLGNALPGAVGSLARSIGVTVPQLMDMMKKGMLNSEKYVGQFADYLYKEFEGGIPKATQTLQAKMTELNNKWNFMLYDIGMAMYKSGIIDFFGEILGKVSNWINLNKELIASGLKEFFGYLRSVFSWILSNWDAIILGLKIWIGLWTGMQLLNSILTITQAVGAMGSLFLPGGLIIGGLIAIFTLWAKITGETQKAVDLANLYKNSVSGKGGKMSNAEFAKYYMSKGDRSRDVKLREASDYYIRYGSSAKEELRKKAIKASQDARMVDDSGVFGKRNRAKKEQLADIAWNDFATYDSRIAPLREAYNNYLSQREINKSSVGQKSNYLENITSAFLKTNTSIAPKQTNSVIEVKLTTDGGSKAEVVSTKGAAPVKVTSNNSPQYSFMK